MCSWGWLGGCGGCPPPLPRHGPTPFLLPIRFDCKSSSPLPSICNQRKTQYCFRRCLTTRAPSDPLDLEGEKGLEVGSGARSRANGSAVVPTSAPVFGVLGRAWSGKVEAPSGGAGRRLSGSVHASDPTDGPLPLASHPLPIPSVHPPHLPFYSLPFPFTAKENSLTDPSPETLLLGCPLVDSSLYRRRVGSIAGPARLLPSEHGGLDPRLGQGEDSLRTKPPGLGKGRL